MPPLLRELRIALRDEHRVLALAGTENGALWAKREYLRSRVLHGFAVRWDNSGNMVRAVLASVVFAFPASAQSITDGDTLKQSGVTYRLWGIDAPEAKQVCPDGWPAGSLATTRLQALTAGRSVVCQEKDRDRYGRIVAICRASGEDLGAILVREGLAWAFVRYSSDYVGQARRRPIGSACMLTGACRRGSGGRSREDERLPLAVWRRGCSG